MQVLEKLFGSTARVKLLRLFLLNPEKVFTIKEIAQVSKVPGRVVSCEVRSFLSFGFVKKGTRAEKMARKKIRGVIVSNTFPLLLALRNLLITASPVSREKIFQYFKRWGKIKLVGLGGVFLDVKEREFADATTSLDLVIVGDGFKKSAFENFIHKLESEIGKELNWALFSTSEFDYRVAMHDKFIRDFLDYPHEFLINKLGIK